ncbi:hypothetical protein M3Y99_00636700 [Aphelenchoides fujianensis]|nr:hypothetical protein M3Y99_00636700 [Aphelenchoides fujianensis]
MMETRFVQPPNPRNPFVQNELLFAAETNRSFSDSRFSIVHQVNSILTGFLGIGSSLMIVYLVLFKTPLHFKAYSRMLLLCALADLTFILCDLWCGFRIRIAGAVIIGAFNGPARLFSPFGQCLSMTVQAIGPQLACFLLPINGYFRYYAIKNNRPPSNVQLAKWLAAMFGLLFVLSLPIAPLGCQWLVSDALMPDLGPIWYHERPIPFLIAADIRHPSVILFLFCFVSILSAAYLVAILYAKRTVDELKQKAAELSARTSALQSQLALTLYVQMASPVVTALVPLLVIFGLMIADYETQFMGDLIMLAVQWSPVLNCISSLWIIKPYRMECWRLVTCRRHKTNVMHTITYEPSRAVTTRFRSF